MRTALRYRNAHHRARRLAAGLLILAAGSLPLASHAGTGRLFLVPSGGYDDNILGRSAASSSRPDVTVAAGFGQLSPVADFRQKSGRWDTSASYAYVYNHFFKPEAGRYQDHAGSIDAAFRPFERLRIGAGGAAEVFRRSRFSEYDLDHREGTLRVEILPTSRVTLRGAVTTGRDHYPRSAVVRPGAGGPDTLQQTDLPLDLELSASVRPSARLSLEAGWVGLEANSNIRLYDYSGDQIFGGITFSPWGNSSVAVAWLHERRDYVAATRLTALRRDRSDTWSLELRGRVVERVSAFLSGSRLSYRSTSSGYGFDQNRGRAGLEIRLGTIGRGESTAPGGPGWRGLVTPSSRGAATDSTGSKAPGDPAGFAPRVSTSGVRFFCRAEGAHSVTLVGSFNGWSRTAMPLTDPDGDGTWEVSVPLAAGTYRYMFYVDGREWRAPADAALYEDDGFGLRNGVLIVP